MSLNSDRSHNSWCVPALSKSKAQHDLNIVLLGRRLEVFRPNSGVWVRGLIVREIEIDSARDSTESINSNVTPNQDNLKWLVDLENGESLWFEDLRGNNQIRFVGSNSVIDGRDGQRVAAAEENHNINLLYANYGRRKGKGPRFAEFTESSSQSHYSNIEVERISESFRSANFHSLKKLPGNLIPDSVRLTSEKTTKGNYKEPSKPIPAHKSLKKSGMFHAYGYIPSALDLEDKQTTKQRLENELKRANIAGGFDHEGKPYSAPFLSGASAASRRLKYEGNFPGSDDGVYPYMSHDFDAPEQLMKQGKARSSGFNLHRKSFGPTGTGFGGQRGTSGAGLSEKPTRRMLPELLKHIHKTLVTDWPKSNFQVSADGEDVVFVRFETKTVDSLEALTGYMNTSTTDNSSALDTSGWYMKYHLRKVVELWGSTIQPDYVSFAFRPPWVKATAASSYQSLHPDTATFASSRTMSGFSGDFKPTVSYGPSLLKRMSNKNSTSEVGFDSASTEDDGISALAFS